jgi:hypothetical protein
VRARGGGVLSASALVAAGTSLLLVVLIGFGLSAMGSPLGGRPSGSVRAEAAAVVVPGSDKSAGRAHAHPQRHSSRTTTRSRPVVSSPLRSGSLTSSAAVVRTTPVPTATPSRTVATASSPKPSAAPTTNGHGNANAGAKSKGNRHGHAGGHAKSSKP